MINKNIIFIYNQVQDCMFLEGLTDLEVNWVTLRIILIKIVIVWCFQDKNLKFNTRNGNININT